MNQPLVSAPPQSLSGSALPLEDAPPPPPPPTFDALPLSADVRKAIDALGYTTPTPVQLAVFEPASRGKSLVVQARTGTGKTAAFGLPIVDSLIRKSQAAVQALILTPTRELALQVGRELERLGQYKGTSVVSIYGGAPMGKQIEQLSSGAQVVSGTPGRVLDHLRRGTLDAKNIRILVLDEADEMLSMGFAKELNAIMEYLPPGDRQGLYFSATIPPDVDRLAKKHLKDPEYITLSGDEIGALQLAHYVYLVRDMDKRSAIVNIIEVEDPQSAVVFCNTKDETQRVAELLQSRGYEADWLNGDLEQSSRERVMQATRDGKIRFLVATDVAARGIDISHLTHVINADFPESAEAYVHRTGRTGRAGRTGTAISVVGPKDVGHLYMLRLTYKIRPVERMLPTAGEKKTRAEADLVAFLADAYAGRTADPLHVAVAKRLFTHDQAASIVAGLLADHLGASGSADPTADAADARRAKAPPPAPIVAPPAVRAERPRDDRPRDDRPRDDRPRDDRPRDDRPRDDRGPRVDRPREDRGPRNDRGPREDRGPRVDRPRDDRAPRDANAPRTLRDGEQVARTAEAPRVAVPAAAKAVERADTNGARVAETRRDEPRGDRGARGERGGRDRGRGRDSAPAAPRGPRDPSTEGVRRDVGMGGRAVGDAAPALFDARERARAAGREGLPQATLSEWEPPADEDDDSPLFGSGSAANATRPSVPAPLAGRSPRGRSAEPRRARPVQDAESTGGLADDETSNLPGFTEGPATDVPAPARREGGREGRRPTREGGRERAPRETGTLGTPAATPGAPAEAREPRAPRAQREPREPREADSSEPRQADGRDDPNLANIFVNIGRRDGASTESLQDILATGGIPHAETGNIRVRDRITFVTVKKELADQAIQALAGQVVGGRTVVAEHARDAR